ncbi:hypothetical protein KAU11_10100, partial [Candidatus Babeliales bacterium]|nr:hypothetical protein [Candidatus Babeliales bacterium]
MAYPDSVTNAATIAPGGSLTASGVTAGMTKYGHDQNLRLQMTLDDVFATFSSDTIKDPLGMDIPNAIFLKLGGDAKRGTQSMTIG